VYPTGDLFSLDTKIDVGTWEEEYESSLPMEEQPKGETSRSPSASLSGTAPNGSPLSPSSLSTSATASSSSSTRDGTNGIQNANQISNANKTTITTQSMFTFVILVTISSIGSSHLMYACCVY
jgi:hypothetical protein